MKLVTLDRNGRDQPGVLVSDDDVLLLDAGSSVRDILDGGEAALDLIRAVAGRAEGETVSLASSVLRPPIPNPRLILSAGLNYGRHLEEMKGTPVPKYPTAFIKVQSSLLGSGQPIMVPPRCPDMVDYEGEFCFVFGKACHDVSEDQAMDYVAGYTIANDVSARDWVGDVFAAEGTFPSVAAWERNIMGKQLPGFTPCGPVFVTADEIDDPHNLQMTTRLNGEVMQSTKTDDLIFKIPAMISYFSKWYRFQAGDIFTTGSPAGVGFGRDPKVFMQPGDVIEVEAEGVGVLRNPIVAR